MPDTIFMQRCLDLALNGAGQVSPNPMVGCVIVHNGIIIGEGYHERYGSAHAEVNAVRKITDKYGDAAAQLLKEATVYVSLEPCAHFGKTPPCADLLIEHAVKKVVVACRDPFPDVDGKGIEKLINAGISVEAGLLEAEAQALNRRFFTRVTQQRPYIILKWAQTADGFFAPEDGSKKWITSESSKTWVHKWRTEEDAIVVGSNTALADNPELTARLWKGKNPLRVLIDRTLKVPGSAKLYNNAAPTLVLNEQKTGRADNIQFIAVEDMHFYLPQKIMYQLYLMDIQSVIIEGGKQILDMFIHAGLWDEVRVFTGPQEWNSGIPAPRLDVKPSEIAASGSDQLAIYYSK